MAGSEAKRYALNCFRRGAAAAIRRSGQTLSEIMRTGGSESYAFREYREIQKEEGRSTKAVIEMDSPDSSPPGILKLPRGEIFLSETEFYHCPPNGCVRPKLSGWGVLTTLNAKRQYRRQRWAAYLLRNPLCGKIYNSPGRGRLKFKMEVIP